MGDPNAPPTGTGPPIAPGSATIDEYVETNVDRYTPEALAATAIAAGYAEADVMRAIEAATARRRRSPDVEHVRRIVAGAYLVTYLVLAAGLLSAPSTSVGSFGVVAVVILTLLLGLAFLMSLGWLAMDWVSSFIGLVSVPLVLLVLVGGACVATTGAPFGLLPR